MNNNIKKAYIIFVVDSKQNRYSKPNIDKILDELSMLCDTANYKVTNRFSYIQQKIDASTYIGKGKLEEITSICRKYMEQLNEVREG